MAGEIEIKGSIDTTMIERGFVKIKKGFERIKSGAKSFGSDMVRIGKATSQAAKALSFIATAGTAAIVGLAKSAPAVAPAMAKIGIETEKLSRILGSQLQPYFDTFANSYAKFVDFVNANPNFTKGFVISSAAIAGIVAMTKLATVLTSPANAEMIVALKALAGIAAPVAAAAVVGVGAAKVAEKGIAKTKQFLYNEAAEKPGSIAMMPGEAQLREEIKKDIKSGTYEKTPDGAIGPWTEGPRRAAILRYWDALWS